MNTNMKKVVSFMLFLAFFLPFGAQAETVLRIGENISVDADQVVDGDYYVSVGPLGNTSMSGSVSQDMYAFGGSVTANGSIGNDLTIVSGVSQLHATVTDDVRIVSGEVTLAEHVGGDLFVIGGVFKMLSSASVAGDVIFFGGEGEINGTVGGSVLGTSDTLRIDAEVGKDVDVKTASQLTLGERAVIAGSVRYASLHPLVRAQNATVEGEVVRNDYKTTSKETDVKDALIPVFVSLFAALSLYLLFRKELQLLAERVHRSPFKSSLFGLSVLIAGPIVSLLLIATVLGLVIGVAGIALVFLAYVLGFALSGVVLGAYLSKILFKKLSVSLVTVVLGTVVLHALLFIPFVGFGLFALVFLLTVGGLAMSVYKILS
jgi:hypothetical protein